MFFIIVRAQVHAPHGTSMEIPDPCAAEGGELHYRLPLTSPPSPLLVKCITAITATFCTTNSIRTCITSH